MVRLEVYVTCDKCRTTYSELVTLDRHIELGDAVWNQLMSKGWRHELKANSRNALCQDVCPECAKEVR